MKPNEKSTAWCLHYLCCVQQADLSLWGFTPLVWAVDIDPKSPNWSKPFLLQQLMRWKNKAWKMTSLLLNVVQSEVQNSFDHSKQGESIPVKCSIPLWPNLCHTDFPRSHFLVTSASQLSLNPILPLEKWFSRKYHTLLEIQLRKNSLLVKVWRCVSSEFSSFMTNQSSDWICDT